MRKIKSMKYPKIQTILQCLLGVLISNLLYAQSSNINFDSTYNAVLNMTNTERKIDTLNYYSKKWVKTNNEESKKMALSALQFAQKIKQKDKVAYSLLNLGNTYHVNSKYDSSLIVYYQAMDIGNEISNKKILEMSYNNIGLVYYRQAIKVRDSTIYFNSLTYLKKSLKIRESLKDTPSIASSLMNISCIFLDLAYFFEKNNYYDSALQCEGRSKYLRGQIGDTLGMGKNLMNIGNVYMSMAEKLHDDGYYKIALSNHLLGLKYKKYVGDIFEIAQSYNNLSMVYFYLQKYDSAIFYADTCSKIAKKISNFRLVLDNYKTLYLSYAQLDKYKEAYWAAMDYFDLNDSLFSQDVSR